MIFSANALGHMGDQLKWFEERVFDGSSAPRRVCATQLDPGLLAAVRGLAEKEGRQIQPIIEEALTDLVEKRRRARPRQHVLDQYKASLSRFGPLYERLAR